MFAAGAGAGPGCSGARRPPLAGSALRAWPGCVCVLFLDKVLVCDTMKAFLNGDSAAAKRRVHPSSAPALGPPDMSIATQLLSWLLGTQALCRWGTCGRLTMAGPTTSHCWMSRQAACLFVADFGRNLSFDPIVSIVHSIHHSFIRHRAMRHSATSPFLALQAADEVPVAQLSCSIHSSCSIMRIHSSCCRQTRCGARRLPRPTSLTATSSSEQQFVN